MEADASESGQRHTDEAAPPQPQVLACPRCGLQLTPRSSMLTIEFCPRCIVRARVAVRLSEASG